MRQTEPSVRLVSRPQLNWDAVAEYLASVDGEAWLARVAQDIADQGPRSDAELLAEFAGRGCYRSWAPGLNANVSKVREDSDAYLRNIVEVGHGSVLEHAQFTFVFQDVSRVFTHELVRHRTGVAISQESMRYVRLTDIPIWFPEWAKEDPELMDRCLELVTLMEEHQVWMAEHFGLDEKDADFPMKKFYTSFMRRFAPDGVSTMITWSANLRTLRHVIEMRTSLAAEEEIRKVFGQVALIMRASCPAIFGDYDVNDDGEWIPGTRKV